MLSPRFVGGAAEDLQIRRIILRGDKEMKKMNKPEVEAIRFDSNDVIATSGAGPTYPGSISFSLLNYTDYSELPEYGFYTIGREIDQYTQYNWNYSQANNNDYYSSDDGDSWTGVDKPNTGAYYAWFDSGYWYTVNQPYPTATEYDN